jgi:hypothetical protein
MEKMAVLAMQRSVPLRNTYGRRGRLNARVLHVPLPVGEELTFISAVFVRRCI